MQHLLTEKSKVVTFVDKKIQSCEAPEEEAGAGREAEAGLVGRPCRVRRRRSRRRRSRSRSRRRRSWRRRRKRRKRPS